ncbi:MAG: ATP-binding protein, partial [SAR324 cluster bacterium]|nr:ATP-binding protein [SAR324 cluster bacterium]
GFPSEGNTGLGLSIAKAFAEKMGGSIGFESQPGVATTFFVDMPILKDESHAD